jgi:hypothetical protein
MEEITINYNPIQTLGYIQCNVPLDIMNITRQEINEMVAVNFCNSKPRNVSLAGVIEHEYSLVKVIPLLNQFFIKVIPEYWKLQNVPEKYNEKYLLQRNNDGDFDVWVNLQQKYEFNPIHKHSGELSFVYWVNIPYDLKDEEDRPSSKGNTLQHPVFSFHYPSFDYKDLFSKYDISVSKAYEGRMIIFPSFLHHQVTPFYTSNDYRISVAGNLINVNNG